MWQKGRSQKHKLVRIQNAYLIRGKRDLEKLLCSLHCISSCSASKINKSNLKQDKGQKQASVVCDL